MRREGPRGREQAGSEELLLEPFNELISDPTSHRYSYPVIPLPATVS